MKKYFIRIVLSLMLVFSMLLTATPAAFANGTTDEMSDIQAIMAGIKSTEEIYGALDPDTVPEIVGYENAMAKSHVKRLYEQEGDDLYKFVFLNADGTQTAYLYDHPVKYVSEDGKIKDITLKITASSISGSFESADACAVTTFSQKMSDGISLRGNGTSVSLVPMLPLTADVQSGLSANDAVSTVMQIDDETVAYRYDSKTSIQYSLTYTGFKENIIVDEYTGRTSYDFTLYTNGLELIDDSGSYYLVDADGDIKATLGDIIIFTADEANNTMGSMTARTVRHNQQYVITVSVDPEWLSDPKTVYPICIDPTVEINYDNNGAGAITDVTLNRNTDSDQTSRSIFIGAREDCGAARILMKFPSLDLDSLGDNISITNATVELRDLMCDSEEVTVSCYVFDGNVWDPDTVTWANVGADLHSTFLSSNVVCYANGKQQTTAHRYSFDITKAVEGWRVGNYNSQKGIIFQTTSEIESSTEYIHKTFASYERSSYRPSLSVTYSTVTHTLDNGTYYLNNRYCGDYLQYNGTPTAKSGLLSTLGNTIQWEIVNAAGSRECYIRSVSSPNRYLAVMSYSDSSSVTTVYANGNSIPDRCVWKLVAVHGGCSVQSAYNSRYLRSTGDNLSTVSTMENYGTTSYDSCVWRVLLKSNGVKELTDRTVFHRCDLMLGYSDTIANRINPSNAIWASISDFEYSDFDDNIVTVNANGTITPVSVGQSNVTCRHKVTDRTFSFTVIVRSRQSNKGTITIWENCEGNVVGYWPQNPTVSYSAVGEFALDDYCRYAKSEWEDALEIAIAETTASDPDIMIYGGTQQQLSDLGLTISSQAAGTTIYTYSIKGCFSYRNGVKLLAEVNAATILIKKYSNGTENGYKNVCVHEMGHALGFFGHSSRTSAVMYYATNGVYELTPREKNHLSQVYSLMR